VKKGQAYIKNTISHKKSTEGSQEDIDKYIEKATNKTKYDR
jgi:hypothetical protein